MKGKDITKVYYKRILQKINKVEIQVKVEKDTY